MAFSSKMNPGQLASWLLKEYGEDYKDETEKLKKGMINGDLFLLLPEDEELLQSLNLGLAFKRLVVMKAKQLKGSANSVPANSSNSEPVKSSGGEEQRATVSEKEKPPVMTKVVDKDERLGIEYFQVLLKAIWDARSKYSNLGLELGVSVETMDSFEKTHRGNTDECFKAVLAECLNGGVTQRRLANALKEKTVGRAGMGDELLAMKIPRIVKQGLVSPVSAQPSAESFDRYEVQSYHLGLMNWSTGPASGQVKVYSSAQSKWQRIAQLLGLEPGEINSIDRNKHDDEERVTSVFHRWFDNANMLPNARKYPKTWSGLIKLLSDAGLSDLAGKLRKALNAPFNDVRRNL